MVKKKQQEVMEEQLKSFAGSTAGSVVIAVGVGVIAFPYAVEYIVKKTTEKGGEALVYAVGIIWQGMKGEAGKVKELLDAKAEWLAKERKKLEAETWHEANPDVTQQDLDIPGGIQEYFERVGLPASSHLVAFGDKESLSVFQHSGEWNYYGTRRINEQEYYLIVPKGIRVYVKIQRTLTAEPENDTCPVGYTIERLPHPSTASICKKQVREQFNVPAFAAWP